jgi:multiple sugar transport system ATP-binding protein
MASVTIRNIRKAYGEVEVIHGLDLDIADGAFVVLLGPSGCGKSTLLRMIAGLESVTSGNVMIADQVVNNVHPKDRNIAMVFQNYALYAHMNVFDNMAFSMQLRRMSKEEIRNKVDWAASILNLTPYLDRFPRQLSGGQRQRVAMGRAIVRDPAVFLFDEPLSNLDAKLRVQMRTEIKELHERLKTTTVYVTHDQIEAMTMADTIVILKDGVIEQQGSPLDVYDRPNNLFVAQFIGSPTMNLLPGRLEAGTGQMAIRLADGSTIDLPASVAAAPGTEIIVGIRPEHLKPSTGAGFKVHITQVEPTGPEIHIYAELAGQEICSITSDRLAVTRGDTITVAPLADRIHVFDAASGKRLSA